MKVYYGLYCIISGEGCSPGSDDDEHDPMAGRQGEGRCEWHRRAGRRQVAAGLITQGGRQGRSGAQEDTISAQGTRSLEQGLALVATQWMTEPTG